MAKVQGVAAYCEAPHVGPHKWFVVRVLWEHGPGVVCRPGGSVGEPADVYCASGINVVHTVHGSHGRRFVQLDLPWNRCEPAALASFSHRDAEACHNEE